MMESKFIKRINVNRHRLSKEIGKVNEAEKSEIKMMDACRRKFRMKYKKLGFPSTTTAYKATIADADDAYPRSSDDSVNDVSDETTSTKNDQESDYAYDAFRSLLFTDDEVDLNKILVLHLLTAHVVAENSGEQLLTDISSSYATEKDLFKFFEKENKSTMNGPWNNILPCYIVKSQRDKLEFHNKRQKPEQVLHQQKDKFIRNSELDCNQLVEDCKESDYSVQTQNLLPYDVSGKVPTISSRMLNIFGDSYRKIDFKNTDEFSKVLNNQKNLTKQRSITSFSNTNFCKNDIKTNRQKYIYCSPLPISTNHRNQIQKIIPVYVNDQLRNLIQDVLNALQAVNPEKTKNFFEVFENTQKISALLKEPKVKLFLQSMSNYSLIFSPENYLVIPTIEIENNNRNSKTIMNKHLIAETLEIQSSLDFHDLLSEIQTNLCNYQKTLANVKINDNLAEESKVQSIENEMTNDSVSNGSQLSVTKKSKNNLIGIRPGEVVSRISKLSSSRASVIQSQIRKAHDFCTTDPDQIILRRMTNAQRILVGQMCASLKTKQINNEGFLKLRVPLISLLKPILSQESIRNLTEGTIYAQDEDEITETEKIEKNSNYIVDGKLTKSIILKLRHEVVESETQQKLKDFMKKPI